MTTLAQKFLAVGIAILLAVFIGYALHVLYEPPHYGYSDTSACFREFNCDNLTAHCAQEQNAIAEKPMPAPLPGCYESVYASAEYKQCLDNQRQCIEVKDGASDRFKHARNSFYILLIIALALIIGSSFWITQDSIRSGVLGGGILVVLWSLIYTTTYWMTWNKYVKLAALAVVLIVLIYVGYKKIESKTQK